MNRKLKKCFDSIVEKNERASEQTCMQILGDLYQAIGEKVSNGGFTQSGGHQAYKDEVWLFVFSHTIFVLSAGGKNGDGVRQCPQQGKGSLR